MGSKSINKGRRGEREVVTALRKWWGGSPWGRRGLGHKGADIVTPDDFPYIVEVKNYKNFTFMEMVNGSKRLTGWWEQAFQQAKNNQRNSLLVVKVHREWWAMAREGTSHFANGTKLIHYGIPSFEAKPL